MCCSMCWFDYFALLFIIVVGGEQYSCQSLQVVDITWLYFICPSEKFKTKQKLHKLFVFGAIDWFIFFFNNISNVSPIDDTNLATTEFLLVVDTYNCHAMQKMNCVDCFAGFLGKKKNTYRDASKHLRPIRMSQWLTQLTRGKAKTTNNQM